MCIFHGLLNGMIDPFNSDHFRAGAFRGEDQAGVHRTTVEQNGAGTALALGANFLDPGEAQIVTQKIE